MHTQLDRPTLSFKWLKCWASDRWTTLSLRIWTYQPGVCKAMSSVSAKSVFFSLSLLFTGLLNVHPYLYKTSHLELKAGQQSWVRAMEPPQVCRNAGCELLTWHSVAVRSTASGNHGIQGFEGFLLSPDPWVETRHPTRAYGLNTALHKASRRCGQDDHYVQKGI